MSLGAVKKCGGMTLGKKLMVRTRMTAKRKIDTNLASEDLSRGRAESSKARKSRREGNNDCQERRASTPVVANSRVRTASSSAAPDGACDAGR